MQNKKLIIGIAFFLIIAGFAGWYIYRDLKFASEDVKHQVSNISQEQGTTTENSANTETDLPTAEQAKIKMPDLDREIIINDKSILEEEKNRAIKNITDIIALLKDDYDRREEWLNLGIWRKNLGDYEGAEEAWEFVIFIRPNDPVAFHNLGDLYSQYLIDFTKAEKYYLLAIENDPGHNPFFYIKLHEFYRYFVKKQDLAESILEKGIKATNDPSLKSLLEQYRLEMSQ